MALVEREVDSDLQVVDAQEPVGVVEPAVLVALAVLDVGLARQGPEGGGADHDVLEALVQMVVLVLQHAQAVLGEGDPFLLGMVPLA